MKDLREALKEKKVVIGTERTLKSLKRGEVKSIYVSKNCSMEVEEDLEYYCKVFNVKLNKVKETNEELGVICKKPFSISVLSF